MKYELRDIPDGHPDGRSLEGDPQGPKEGRGFNGAPYTTGIYAGDRWVFRFRADGTRPTMQGTSFAEMLLAALNFRAAEV